MLIIDCPWCTGPAATDQAVATLVCEDCGVSVDVAPDGPGDVLVLVAAA